MYEAGFVAVRQAREKHAKICLGVRERKLNALCGVLVVCRGEHGLEVQVQEVEYQVDGPPRLRVNLVQGHDVLVAKLLHAGHSHVRERARQRSGKLYVRIRCLLELHATPGANSVETCPFPASPTAGDWAHRAKSCDCSTPPTTRHQTRYSNHYSNRWKKYPQSADLIDARLLNALFGRPHLDLLDRKDRPCLHMNSSVHSPIRPIPNYLHLLILLRHRGTSLIWARPLPPSLCRCCDHRQPVNLAPTNQPCSLREMDYAENPTGLAVIDARLENGVAFAVSCRDSQKPSPRQPADTLPCFNLIR